LRLGSIRNFTTLSVELAIVFVSAAAADRPTEDPEVLLRRIRSRIAAHLSQLPNYACREVVDRALRRGTTWNHLDTVQFEVALVGREELFSRPGEEKFGERSIGELAPGTITNRVLGSQVDMIFASDAAEFRYVGTAKKDGRQTFRYDFRVPQDKSGFEVTHDSARAIVPFEGSVWVDVETLDLVRADLKVNHIPSNVRVRSIEKSIHYRLIHIADADFQLPGKTELSATDDLGNYSLTVIRLDQCREFTGESTIKYGAPTQGPTSRDRLDHPEH
jgi:hypothetical protein